MRAIPVVMGFLMMAALVAGHVDTRHVTREGDRVPVRVATVPVPVEAAAGVEVLFRVR